MENIGLGAGLAALAFWGFIAAVVVGGMWYSIREKEAKQETIRRLIESGQPLGGELADRLIALTDDSSSRTDRDLRLAALIVLPIAVGLFLFGIILGFQEPDARAPLIGISVLVAFVGGGLWIASRVAERWYESDER